MASVYQRKDSSGKPISDVWNVRYVDRVYSDPDRKMLPNPLSLKPNTPLCWFVDEDDAVTAKVKVDTEVIIQQGIKVEAFPLAGPRLDIAFDPKQCKAAVVTCGGLCPGEFCHGSLCCGLIHAANFMYTVASVTDNLF